MQTKDMLVRRGYLLASPVLESEEMAAYYAAKILSTFGVLVDKPHLVNEQHVRDLSELFHIEVPKSFYANPQDTKHFSRVELLLEQIVSYMRIEWVDGVDSTDPETFKRIELFKKALPDYEEGKEVEFRNYQILDTMEAIDVLKEIGANLATYTRPFSETERDEYLLLYKAELLDEQSQLLKSKDNAIEMLKLTKDVVFSGSLDQKDVVKLSVDLIGETKEISYDSEQRELLLLALTNCRPVPLTKKQSKFFNQLSKKLLKNPKLTNNDKSPYKAVVPLLNDAAIGGPKVLEAAKIFAKNGSLLERNLVWLLSRAESSEIQDIMDLVKVKNPIVGIQLLQTLTSKTQGPRVFKFYNDRKIKSHIETDKEYKYRKTVLSEGVKKEVKKAIYEKIDQYYLDLPKLGKVFVSDIFDKMPLPLNTSASGSGLDVYPVGTRVPITEDFIRAFIHWDGPYDVDFSISLFDQMGKEKGNMYFGNYSNKEFGNDILFSGDDRSNKGAEYFDINLDGLKRRGISFAVLSANGYRDKFNKGETFAGLQYKKDLETQAWSPKNIKFQTRITGDSHAFQIFGIDLLTMEIVVINQTIESGNRVVTDSDLEGIKHLMDADFAKLFNVKRLLTLRATEIVDNPADADVVFDREYIQAKPTEEDVEFVKQTVIRPSDIEKIVSIIK